MDPNILEKFWKSRKTILEVLIDRKYPIDKKDFLTYDEFVVWVNDTESIDIETLKENMGLTYEINNQPDSKIMIFWPKELKVGTNIRTIYRKMEEENVKRAIIVIDVGVTAFGSATVRGLKQINVNIDIYTFPETLFNVTKHSYVPSHLVCTPDEKKKIMKSYAVNNSQLPHIKATDPVVRHFGASRGELIQITRDSETQPGYKSITYRLVV
uniref:DNA-directed RNA polymerase subunit 5 n=1 Tax=Marseillevirus LCMAC102 TaxID=2506603 RepID=A0A481YVD5_9VIRU|nr:MAG: DNA-directed RNA polymerase subunit 5 [Marseillevirus LCMAC102]